MLFKQREASPSVLRDLLVLGPFYLVSGSLLISDNHCWVEGLRSLRGEILVVLGAGRFWNVNDKKEW